MCMNGAGTENQLFGYFEVAQAACQQAQDLYLPRSQVIRIRYRCSRSVARRPGWSRGLSLRSQGLLCCHRAALSPGGGKGSLANVGARGRDRAFVVGLLDERNGDAARLT